MHRRSRALKNEAKEEEEDREKKSTHRLINANYFAVRHLTAKSDRSNRSNNKSSDADQ